MRRNIHAPLKSFYASFPELNDYFPHWQGYANQAVLAILAMNHCMT